MEEQVKILAFHQNPPVYDGIAAGDLLGAANDHTVIQGRMAVDMAVRLLEGQTLEPSNRAGPVITMMTPDNLRDRPSSGNRPSPRRTTSPNSPSAASRRFDRAGHVPGPVAPR